MKIAHKRHLQSSFGVITMGEPYDDGTSQLTLIIVLRASYYLGSGRNLVLHLPAVNAGILATGSEVSVSKISGTIVAVQSIDCQARVQ